MLIASLSRKTRPSKTADIISIQIFMEHRKTRASNGRDIRGSCNRSRRESNKPPNQAVRRIKDDRCEGIAKGSTHGQQGKNTREDHCRCDSGEFHKLQRGTGASHPRKTESRSCSKEGITAGEERRQKSAGRSCRVCRRPALEL